MKISVVTENFYFKITFIFYSSKLSYFLFFTWRHILPKIPVPVIRIQIIEEKKHPPAKATITHTERVSCGRKGIKILLYDLRQILGNEATVMQLVVCSRKMPSFHYGLKWYIYQSVGVTNSYVITFKNIVKSWSFGLRLGYSCFSCAGIYLIPISFMLLSLKAVILMIYSSNAKVGAWSL